MIPYTTTVFYIDTLNWEIKQGVIESHEFIWGHTGVHYYFTDGNDANSEHISINREDLLPIIQRLLEEELADMQPYIDKASETLQDMLAEQQNIQAHLDKIRVQ